MTLQNYLANQWIRRHETSPIEISSLLALADRDIGQSQTPGLGAEWRFSIAYNAALQLATAALAGAGFQAERQNKHQRTLETLEWTVWPQHRELVLLLDQFRRKRHTNIYEQSGSVSDREADKMIEVVRTLRKDVAVWLSSRGFQANE